MNNEIINYNKHDSFSIFCQTVLGVQDITKFLQEKYTSGMSCNHLSEHFLKEYGVKVTAKGIEYYLKKNYIYNSDGQLVPDSDFSMRTKALAKRNAMSKKRMVYRKKPEHEKYKSKSISAGTRMELLLEADYRCSLCGNGRHNGSSLEIHHKDFNEKNNNNSNYQVLCFLCHRGLHSLKNEE